MARMGQKRNTCSILVSKPDRKRRLALVGDNIKVDFGETEWRNMGFVDCLVIGTRAALL